jgi:Ca-activated chloride channel family protein
MFSPYRRDTVAAPDSASSSSRAAGWLVNPRSRRALALGSVVLAVGGLVLLRTPTSGAGPLARTTGDQHQVGSTGSPGGSETFTADKIHGLFALQGSRVHSGAGQSFFAEVRLWTDKAAEGAPRAPLSLSIVLDRSGSMEGQKLEEAKRAITRLVGEMKDDDEVSFVQYSDSAETLQSLARVGDVRSALLAKVRDLRADGGTNIAAGLRQGARTLEGANPGHVRRVILVSDGLDSSRVESERVASDGSEHHVTTSTIGIGLDFNEAYMSSVARIGHGNFAFAAGNETGRDTDPNGGLATFMHAEMTQGASTLARDASVHVRIPAGFHFVSATGANAVDRDGDVELKLGDLAAEDDRRVLVEMRSDLATGDARSFGGTLQWTALSSGAAGASEGGAQKLELPRLDVVAAVDQAEIDGSENAEVLASAGSITASKQQLEAAEAYAHGDVARARGLAAASQSAAAALEGRLETMPAASTAVTPLAPAPMMALQRQIDSYKDTSAVFGSAAPSSTAGKAAAKRAVMLDSRNLSAPGKF